MQPVQETRRIRLGMLYKKYRSWADLCEAIGWERTNTRLSQIHSGTIRSDRGTPYVMGDETAREIEEKLQLPTGWMDTPPTYAELHGEESPMAKALLVMEQMDEEQQRKALQLLDVLAQPTLKTGTQ